MRLGVRDVRAVAIAMAVALPVAGSSAADAVRRPSASAARIVPGSRGIDPGHNYFGEPSVVAAGDDGTVAVAFTHVARSGTTGTAGEIQDAYERSTLLVAVRRPDGRWERTRTVSDPREGVVRPRVVVDRHGRVLVVWLHMACADRPQRAGCASLPGKVLSRSLSPRGRWGPIVTLSRNAVPDPSDPDPPAVAVAASGAAVVAWKGRGTYAVYRSAGGEFGPVRKVPGISDQVVAAMGRGGRAYVAGIAGQGESNSPYVAVSMRRAASPWRRARRISNRPASNPRIAVAADGAVVVCWHAAGRETGIDFGYGGARAAIGTPAGRFARPQRLGDEPVYAVRVATGAADETIVSWASKGYGGPPTGEQGLRFAVRLRGGSFGAAQTIEPSDRGGEVGDGTVGLTRGGLGLWFSTRDNALRLATRPAGGSFGTPRVIARGGAYYRASATSSSIAAVVGEGGPVLRIVTVRP